MQHHIASKLVAGWNARPVEQRRYDGSQQPVKTVVLDFPNDSYVTRVAFHTLAHRADAMLVRATNWRCEDEPDGVFAIEDCRKFYSQLLKAGFVRTA